MKNPTIITDIPVSVASHYQGTSFENLVCMLIWLNVFLPEVFEPWYIPLSSDSELCKYTECDKYHHKVINLYPWY